MTRLPLKYYKSIFHWLLGIVSPSKVSVFHAEEEHIDEYIIRACDNILKVEEALKEARRKLELAKMTSEQSVVEYYETVIDALEKQIPKKPIKVITKDNEHIATLCPCCSYDTFGDNQDRYCIHCGQKIDWSDEDES